MDSLINPYTTVICLALILIVLDLVKPQISRVFLGLFFLLMALGVNLTLLLTAPQLYVEVGRNAWLPLYRWFFTVVIAWNPPVFLVPLIIFESAVGILILSKGHWNRIGLVLGTLFCLFTTPIGIEEITSPALALAVGLLLRKDFDRSFLEIIVGWFHRKPAVQLMEHNLKGIK